MHLRFIIAATVAAGQAPKGANVHTCATTRRPTASGLSRKAGYSHDASTDCASALKVPASRGKRAGVVEPSTAKPLVHFWKK
jgi:hypothetical protein